VKPKTAQLETVATKAVAKWINLLLSNLTMWSWDFVPGVNNTA